MGYFQSKPVLSSDDKLKQLSNDIKKEREEYNIKKQEQNQNQLDEELDSIIFAINTTRRLGKTEVNYRLMADKNKEYG